MVKKTVLDQFIRRGGYDLVERKNGKWRNIAEASRKTGVSRPTIYRLLTEHPEPPRTAVWMTEDDRVRIEGSLSRLKGAVRLLRKVHKYFERSLIVDLLELRARQELQGMSIESFQLELKKQVEAGEKRKSAMEKTLEDA